MKAFDDLAKAGVLGRHRNDIVLKLGDTQPKIGVLTLEGFAGNGGIHERRLHPRKAKTAGRANTLRMLRPEATKSAIITFLEEAARRKQSTA